MPIPERKTTPTCVADIWVQVTDDGSRTLVHRDPDSETSIQRGGFHSGCGALAETRHVYLHNSGVADRLKNHTPTSVLEIGLGTGMGLLVTVDAAQSAGTSLRYEAWESDWLPAIVLKELKLRECVEDQTLADRMIEFRETIAYPAPDGIYSMELAPTSGVPIDVRVRIGNAVVCEPSESEKFDAIYFDPFAPNVNPELWDVTFLSKMSMTLCEGGRLVTYCCNRQVRDAMTAAGFSVHRVAGPKGGKREVLVAIKDR